jgi:sigma-B regulation protein RsbU (phosphoserine phosphatase)
VIPEVEGLEIAAQYMAPGQLAGDFHLVAPADDGVTIVAIGDAIGHGTEAARQASFVRASLAAFAAHTTDPARLLRLANASLIERVGTSGRFATCACLAVHPDGRLDVALAGHPAPLRLDSGEPLDGRRSPPLAVDLDFAPVDSTFTLGGGEGLLLYTDGLTESKVTPESSERLGEERVREALARCAGAGPDAVLEVLTALTPDLSEGTPGDDVCLLALRRR